MAEKPQEVVATAKRAARDFMGERSVGDDWRWWLNVCSASERPSLNLARQDGALLSAQLTPENTASEDALVRALLASAITTQAVVGADRVTRFIGIFCGHHGPPRRTEAGARDALFDALLAKGPSDA